MNTRSIGPVAIFIGILVLVVGFGACQYNSMVNADVEVDSKWSQVENQLQRRADLIPNLLETVKGYAAHEKEIFTAVAEARSKLIGAKTVSEKAAADQEMQPAL